MITVGLPVYNQTDILSLALTGLSKQKNAGEWELIVCSEDAVNSVVNKFKDKLNRAGCSKVIIKKLNEWIPLPQKWRMIGQMMHLDSIGMILQAADCYPHPDRIRQSKDAMVNGYDWYHEQRGYFYDVNTKKVVLFNGAFSKKSKTYLNMCIASRHVRSLPLSDKKKGIDGWLLQTIPNPNIYLFKGLPKGVDFHGKNNISTKRGAMIKKCKLPFFKVSKKLKDII